MEPHIRMLEIGDIQSIASAFRELAWNKPAEQYARYFEEQQHNRRAVLVAFVQDNFCGYLTICWQSNYAPFREANIPEIVDFNVLPQWRRQGIGTRLMDEAEGHIARRSTFAGIGVGLTADYGSAQRLYAKRGYVPDGRGIVYDHHPVHFGQQVVIDDALVLYFTKSLPNGSSEHTLYPGALA
jgi:GNAT superfamily N-acetyltransferase